MKTIFKNGTYERVSNEVAELKISKGWKFVPKQEWKQNFRDIKNSTPEVVVEEKVKSDKKLQRRKTLKSKQY